MNLGAYLTQTDGKIDREGAECVRLAGAVDSTPYYLYMLALGHKTAGPTLAIAIERESHRQVLRAELRPDLWGDEPTAEREG